MQWDHQHQFILQSCNLLFSFEAFSRMKKPYAIKIVCTSDAALFTSCKLGCTSNGDIHCKWLLLYLVKEVPSFILYPWGMVRDTLVSESFALAGRRLVAAHCKKRTFFFDVFNSLVWNSLHLIPDMIKRLMNLKRKAVSNFQMYLERDILGHWFLFLTAFSKVIEKKGLQI